MKRKFTKTPVKANYAFDGNHGYHPPVGPTEDDFPWISEEIARYTSKKDILTTEDVVECFRSMCDDFDDWWARGVRGEDQEKEVVRKLCMCIDRDVIDNSFGDGRSVFCTSCKNINASYSPFTLDELIDEYQDYDLDLVYDFVMEGFGDEDLANDVVSGVEARQYELGLR